MFFILLLILPVIVKSTPVIGGKDAGKMTTIGRIKLHAFNPGKHPYLAYLKIRGILLENEKFENNIFENEIFERQVSSRCGGVLIAPDIILTAAHCVVDATIRDIQIEATVGVVHPKMGSTLQKAKVKDYIVHKDYIRGSPITESNRQPYNQNDIAILWLNKEFILTDKVQTAILAEPNFPVDEQLGVIAGWGQTDNGIEPNILQEGTLRVISNKNCRIAHWPSVISKSMLCAISDDGKTVHSIGDSGGPLVVDGVVVGLVSWAESKKICTGGKIRNSCDPSFPGVFTRVSEFIQWIEDNVQLGPPKTRKSGKVPKIIRRIIKTSKRLPKTSFSGSENLTNDKDSSARVDCLSGKFLKSCTIL